MADGNKKILHLVLYNPAPQYHAMYEITRSWYREWRRHKVQTFYYFYDPYVPSPTIDEEAMTLRLPGNETYYPGILMKTLEAFEYFSKDGFDFIVRSNISSPINFAVLIPMLQPKSMLYGGPHLINPYLVDTQKANPLVCAIGPMRFVQGTCIVFSPDCIRFLLNHRSELEVSVEDDLSFGLLFARHKIKPVQMGGQFAFFNSMHNLDIAVTFRNHDVGSDRKNDIQAIEHQVQILFQRYIFLRTKQLVSRVTYGTKDVTELVHKCCIEKKIWTTNQGNAELDTLFGDPQPGVAKNLSVSFKFGDRDFKQRCQLTFETTDNNQLWVY